MLMATQLIGFGAVTDGGNGVQTTFGPATTTIAFGSSALAIGDRTTAITNSITIYRLGLYATVGGSRTIKLKILKYNSGTSNVDVVADTGAVTHAASGWEWFSLATPYVVAGSGTFWLCCYCPSWGTVNDYITNDTESSVDITGASVTMTDHAARETVVMGYET